MAYLHTPSGTIRVTLKDMKRFLRSLPQGPGGPLPDDLTAYGVEEVALPPVEVAVAARQRKADIRRDLMTALEAEYPDEDGALGFAEGLAQALAVQAYKEGNFTTPAWDALTVRERNLLDQVRARGIRQRAYLEAFADAIVAIDAIVADEALTDDEKRTQIAAVEAVVA